jgi:hypothetical protein
MNIDNLKKALEILRKEINIKDSNTRNFHILIESIAELGLLIKRLENPKKTIKLDKLRQ